MPIKQLTNLNLSKTLNVEGKELIHDIPEPSELECPVSYSERIGKWYSAFVSPYHKKQYGQYFTPARVADFMAHLLSQRKETITIIDPGAGTGILSCAACKYLSESTNKPTQIILDVYENDESLLEILQKTLAHLSQYLHRNKVKLTFTINVDDFILYYAHRMREPTFFNSLDSGKKFDICISNPPYFKIPKSDPRSYAAENIVHGQPNIYALFMAVGASLLVQKGELVFITPRSFASGPYFRLFRERFFETMKPQYIHIFESRRDTFKHESVLQENIIIKAQRQDKWDINCKSHKVFISSSLGVDDIDKFKIVKLPIGEVLNTKTKEKILRINNEEHYQKAIETMSSWTGSLYEYGLEVSTGPVVPFRAIRFISEEESEKTHTMLLWLQNVRPMQVIWPDTESRKPQYIEDSCQSQKLLLPNKNYVLLRRFSAKEEIRRLTAAPFVDFRTSIKWIGIENHLNYIYRIKGFLSEEESFGLSVLYNSSFFNAYFRTLNGNTQVSATEIRSIPLPPLNIIKEIGKKAITCENIVENIDKLAQLAFQ
jgi:adenine-specific DNA-methyltransferase